MLLLVLPISLYGAVAAWYGNANDILDWLPDKSQSRRQLDQFVRLFGSDEILMISWEGCSPSDSRVEEFRERLLEPVDTAAGKTQYFRDVLTGPSIAAYFTGEPLNLTDAQAHQRMRGWIVSDDGQTTGLVATVTPAGTANQPAVVERALKVADEIEGLSRDRVRIAGPTVEAVSVNQASHSYLLELNLASYAICLGVLLVCLRSLRAAVLIFLLALFNEQLSMALIHYTGSHMDSILLLTANLTFVLTISMGVHLFNYYRDAVHDDKPGDPVQRAWRAAWKPTTLATITTVFGLISLSVSEIRPIKKFGAYSATALVLALGVTFLFVALHFDYWPLRLRKKLVAANNVAGPKRRSRWVAALDQVKWPVIVASLMLIIGGGFGISKLRTSVGLDELLPERTRIIQDYHWLEARIGPLIPVEVLVKMPAASERETLDQFRTLRDVHQRLEQLDSRYAVLSAVTFAPEPPPKRGGARQLVIAAAYRRKLQESMPQLERLGYLAVDGETRYWRLTIRTVSTERGAYGELLDRIQDRVQAALDKEGAVSMRDVVVSGSVPLIFQTQEQLLKDLIRSFLLAFALVAITLMLLFRSVSCGLICMIPNLLPSVAVFGLMGWLDRPVDIGSILTASAALGVAVDDSLHFITWFRRAIADGATVKRAVAAAYGRCGAAMIQTTLICGLGLVVFGLSPFAPVSRFGVFMCALLVIALIGDLVVLPAILLSPLGASFLVKTKVVPSDVDADDRSDGKPWDNVPPQTAAECRKYDEMDQEGVTLETDV